ncbi:hypothetical protein SUGI_1084350 [Cryptomeria japonica]|nr:hypothetical protein SUGI_1084350 [Cryptomeria japonica]
MSNRPTFIASISNNQTKQGRDGALFPITIITGQNTNGALCAGSSHSTWELTSRLPCNCGRKRKGKLEDFQSVMTRTRDNPC